jgi:hypothetical protein
MYNIKTTFDGKIDSEEIEYAFDELSEEYAEQGKELTEEEFDHILETNPEKIYQIIDYRNSKRAGEDI